ncbi:MAG: hypothetical protein AAB308_08975, partial [Nitrospirota bacterium]
MQRTVAKRWATQLGCLVMMTVLVSGCDQQNRGTSDSSTSTPHTQSSTPAPAASATPPWVIDPTEPGTNLPPAGRSLFDFLITKDVNGKKIYDIPFPFSA